jgi:hypothetical protein
MPRTLLCCQRYQRQQYCGLVLLLLTVLLLTVLLLLVLLVLLLLLLQFDLQLV